MSLFYLSNIHYPHGLPETATIIISSIIALAINITAVATAPSSRYCLISIPCLR